MYRFYMPIPALPVFCVFILSLMMAAAQAQNTIADRFWVLNSSTEILAADGRGFTKREPGGWMGEIAFRKRADCLYVLEKTMLEAGYDTRQGLKAEVFFDTHISRKFETVNALGDTQRFTIECRQSQFVDKSAWD
ncbi:MAG: hypothetical protein ACPGGG_08885 [Parvibaculales bacterium]